MNSLIEGLIYLGFTKEEAEKQVGELDEIIGFSFSKRIEEEAETEVNPDKFDEYIKENYPEEELKKILAEVSGEEVKNYIDAVTRDMPKEKIDHFYKIVKENS